MLILTNLGLGNKSMVLFALLYELLNVLGIFFKPHIYVYMYIAREAQNFHYNDIYEM